LGEIIKSTALGWKKEKTEVEGRWGVNRGGKRSKSKMTTSPWTRNKASAISSSEKKGPPNEKQGEKKGVGAIKDREREEAKKGRDVGHGNIRHYEHVQKRNRKWSAGKVRSPSTRTRKIEDGTFVGSPFKPRKKRIEYL